ncbi:efflux RND transporter periplasmic adaptor subunit [Pseudobutyrivibrio ruminis]|uniref:Multidrug efflux pump subunit AcrA (Membrane-fusion protein) n=1 Tax=Pseudobutyrivibrio ruminis DSM 9787 TaxID=1123011 RepID=A0A285S378_9FIRM|nr:efflux RND transporter periplasmic adaptor subunit [Pseudobutyrivibrio ruminis]SOC01453.1 Multidrug efflux pump subunit AcrA (membrane-fusion protein) [Pseudobutyrivibrio ruminis DSM 9787]
MGVIKKIGGFCKKHLKLIIILVVIIGVVLFIRHKAQVAAQAMLDAQNEPVTSTVEKMDLKKSVGVTGTLTANETLTVTSTLGGTGVTGVKVSTVNYEVGDYVEKGQTVVEFDGDDYERKLTELNLQNDITNTESSMSIEDMQKSIETTQKKIDEKQKWLDDNKAIYENLKDAFDQYEKYKDSDPSVVERWNRESAAAAGRSEPVSVQGYEAVEDEVETLKEQIRTTQNKIELAQMQQNYAQNYTQVDAKNDLYESMDKTKVAAPISGYILTMNVEEGNNYTQGNTVFTIADTSGFIVEATVNEYDVANIQKDLPATVKFEATGDEEFTGTVSFVSIASESTTSAATASSNFGTSTAAAASTGSAASYKLKIKMDGTDDRFRVGMTAKASIVLDSASDVLAVPYDCVQQKDDGSFFVTSIADDGTKKDIPVNKGLESDYYVEISGDGIKEGMTVEAIVSDAPSTDIMDYMTFE